MEYPRASGIRRTPEPEMAIGRDGNSRGDFLLVATVIVAGDSRRRDGGLRAHTPIHLIELPTRARQGVGDEVPVVQVRRFPPV